MIEAFRVGVTLAVVNQASFVLGMIARDFAKTDAQAKRLQKTLKDANLLVLGGSLMMGAGFAGLRAVKGWYDEAKQYEQALGRFSALNLGAVINRDADQFAQSSRVMGASATDLITTLTDLHTVFGNYGHARALTPLIAQMEFANKALYGDSAGFNRDQALKMGKVIEIRGGFQSEGAMRTQADYMQRILSGTGGRVTPTDYLSFLKTSGVAGRLQKNDVFYYQMEPLIQELGGQRVGTSLMSAYNNLAQGRTTTRTAKELERLGLVLPGMAEYTKIGTLNRIKPGGVKGGDLVASDPMAFMRTILLPALAAKGITDQKAVTNEIATLFTNRTAASLFSLIYLQAAKMDKNIRIDKNAMGVQGIIDAAKKTPQGQEAMAAKAWENLKIQFGLKIIPILLPLIDRFSSAVQTLALVAERHPNLTAFFAITVAGLSALAVVIGGIAVVAGSIMLIAAAVGGGITAGTALIIGAIAAGIVALGAAVVIWWPKIKGFFGSIIGFIWDKVSWLYNKVKSFLGFGDSKAGQHWVTGTGAAKGHWEAGSGNRPVQVTTNLHLDGKQIAQSVATFFGEHMSGPPSSASGFDPRLTPAYSNFVGAQ